LERQSNKHFNMSILNALLFGISTFFGQFNSPTSVQMTVPLLAPGDSITVYVFLTEACPICKSVTLELKRLEANYRSKGIRFVGVFPNLDRSNDTTIAKFAKVYKLPFALKLDQDHQLTRQFSATITPEVFVMRTRDFKVLYSGRIDNGFEAIGKRRQVITEHYLQTALDNLVQQQPIHPAKTQAVGCFITQ